MLNTLQEESDNLQDWLNFNKFKLNANKAKTMLINIKNAQGIIGGEVVKVVSYIKYLSVIIVNKLQFGKNANYVTRKIPQKIGVIRRLSSKVGARRF